MVPLKSKSESGFLAGVMEAFRNLGGKPLVIYSDQEGAWNGKCVQQYLKEKNIKLFMALSHAPIAERAIGAIKNMLYKRLEFEPHRPWYGDLLQQVLLTYNYGREHSTLGMTPNEARKPANEQKVEKQLASKGLHDRAYPPIKVGDQVRIYKEKDKMDKQHTSVWTKQRYTVEGIVRENDQNFYKTSNYKVLLRHEILLAPS